MLCRLSGKHLRNEVFLDKQRALSCPHEDRGLPGPRALTSAGRSISVVEGTRIHFSHLLKSWEWMVNILPKPWQARKIHHSFAFRVSNQTLQGGKRQCFTKSGLLCNLSFVSREGNYWLSLSFFKIPSRSLQHTTCTSQKYSDMGCCRGARVS